MVKHAGFIYNTSKIVHCTVNELLDKSLLERQSIQPKNSSMSLVHLLKDTVTIMETQIRHNQMQIKYSGPKFGVFVKVDEIRVQQILLNLITNAMKFSPPKSTIALKL